MRRRHVQHGFIVKLVIKTWTWLMPYQIINSTVVKCRFKSSCPGSPHTFSMSAFELSDLIDCNMKPTNYEKPFFFQPTHLKLMCKQDNSQALRFCMLRRPPTRLCLQFSYNWTKVVQNEQNYPSCSLVWSLGVLVTGFLQWLVGWYAAAAHAQWANVGKLLMKRSTAFKGILCRNCQLLSVNKTSKLGPSSWAQRHQKCTACMYAASYCCRNFIFVVKKK